MADCTKDTPSPVVRWSLRWVSNNITDGARTHLIFENCIPVLFRTRRDARAYAEKRYGYIKTRPDLMAEPHGWRMPRPLRVTVFASGIEAGTDETGTGSARSAKARPDAQNTPEGNP